MNMGKSRRYQTVRMRRPPEQVARAVARDCRVGGGVEGVEEHGREEGAMRGGGGGWDR